VTIENSRLSNSAPELKRGRRKREEFSNNSASEGSEIDMVCLDSKNHDDPESNRKLHEMKENFLKQNRQKRLKNRQEPEI
jgi:hypothetical protein